MSGSDVNWVQYTEAAQHLSVVRRDERARAAQLLTVVNADKAEADRLDGWLRLQGGQLLELGHDKLGQPEPQLGGVSPSSVAEPRDGLLRANAALADSVRALQEALDRAIRPPLWPNMSPTTRAASVYGLAAFVGTVISFFSVLIGGASPILFPWGVCGLPALAFFAGYLTLGTVGQPKDRGDDGKNVLPRYPRLGGLICFPGSWVMFLAFLAVDYLLTK